MHPKAGSPLHEMAAYDKERTGQSSAVSSGGRSNFLTADTLLVLYEQLFYSAVAAQRRRQVDHFPNIGSGVLLVC